MTDPEEARRLARLAAIRETIRAAVDAAGLDPGLAVAALAQSAGENAAVFAAEQGLALEPLLDEAARVMRRRGAAVHHALRPDTA